MSLDPIDYCDSCFFRGKPNLCETYKGTFSKISSIHFSQQRKLDRILNGFNSRPKLVNRRWTCILGKSNRREFIDSLWGLGITIHTLEDHVKILTKLYKPEVRKQGDLIEIELSPQEEWIKFDPKTHTWNPLEISAKKFLIKIELGTVLKSKDFETEKYFRIIMSDVGPILIPMEKRAAYNIMVTQFEPSTVYWQTGKKNQIGFIKIESLENLPDEIFTTLLRLGTDEKVKGFLNFDEENYELVQSVLTTAKMNLERSSEIIDLGDEKKDDTLVIDLESLEKARLEALIMMINEIGGKIEPVNDCLSITGKIDSIKLGFVDSEKSNQEGKMMFVSLTALKDPPRIIELLTILKKRLGLLSMSIENLVCRNWPILDDSDLQYILHSLIEYSKIDKNLALSVLKDQEKFDKVNDWNNNIKTGKVRSNLDTIVLGKILALRRKN